MWDHEIRAMASTHAIIAAWVFMATVLPAVFVPGFSVYGTHLLWLYAVSGVVTAVSVAVFWLLGITPPTKKHSLGYKVTVCPWVGSVTSLKLYENWLNISSVFQK